MTQFIPCDHRHWRAEMTMNFNRDRPLKPWLIARKSLPQPPVQFRIAGLPNFVADVNTPKIHVVLAEADERFAPADVHAIDASALFLLIGMTRIKHHAIAGFQWSLQLH